MQSAMTLIVMILSLIFPALSVHADVEGAAYQSTVHSHPGAFPQRAVVKGAEKRTFLLAAASGSTESMASEEADSMMAPGQAYFDFGVFAFEDGDYEDAESNFVQALGADGENPYYNHYMGKTYQKMNRNAEAIDFLLRAWQLNPDIIGLRYDLAMQYYQMSDYKKAADLFQAETVDDPTNILAYYYMGVSQYKLENYEAALTAFFTAAEKSPSIKINCYYYAGICYRKMGKLDKSVEHFTYVRDNTDSDDLKENARKWLKEIERYRVAQRPLKLYLKLGVAYDDNVRLEPLDEDIYADEDDFKFVGYFSGRFNIFNWENLKMGIGYSHYQTLHNDLDLFDLIGSIPSAYIRYRWSPFTFSFTYIPSFYWLDGQEYLRRHELRPELRVNLSRQFTTRLTYSYFDVDNVQDDDRDGYMNKMSLDLYYSVPNTSLMLFGGGGYEELNADHPDQEYGQSNFKLGVTMMLPGEFDLNITGRYHLKRYENVDTLFHQKREDDKYAGSITLSHKLFYSWLNIIAEYSYTRNDSNITASPNIEIYDYERQVATLSLSTTY